jgi:hypothetical protein
MMDKPVDHRWPMNIAPTMLTKTMAPAHAATQKTLPWATVRSQAQASG